MRTEAGFKRFLATHGLIVKSSNTHGSNQCLIDSLVQALSHAGLLQANPPILHRAALCSRVREHLVEHHGASRRDYLAHDQHVRAVFEYLREHEAGIWQAGVRPDLIECTVIVFDRFTCRAELVEPEPVRVPARGDASPRDVQHVQVWLHGCVSRDGVGYHYEWIHGR